MQTQAIGLFSDTTLQSAKLALQASVARHEAIAANVANVNTPGYKRIDLAPAFTQALEQAFVRLDSGQRDAPLPRAQLAEDPTARPGRYDGNTVDLDRELTTMIENNARHEFAADILRRRYSGLRTAITGRSQ